MSDKKPKEVDANATQDTVAPAPKGKHDEKQVNVPVSASNALTPEAGVQIKVDSEDTKDVVKTDSHNPQLTKPQAILTDEKDLHDAVVESGDLVNPGGIDDSVDNKTHSFLSNHTEEEKKAIKKAK